MVYLKLCAMGIKKIKFDWSEMNRVYFKILLKQNIKKVIKPKFGKYSDCLLSKLLSEQLMLGLLNLKGESMITNIFQLK